jgi:hypothetical protein
MKLEQWSFVSQIIGAVAVVLSLIFVGVSIQQNTRAIRLSTAQNFQADFRQHELASAQSSDLMDIMYRIDQSLEVTPVEAERARAFSSAILRAWANAYFQYENGVLDHELWEGQAHRMARTWARFRALRDVWAEDEDMFQPGFVEFMHKNVAKRAVEDAKARPTPEPVPPPSNATPTKADDEKQR